jgi:hypothetical protein
MKNTVICVLLLALMLAAGCSAPSTPATPGITSSIPATTVPVTIAIPALSTAPVLCTPVNGTPYVSIDPINGTHLRDTITVHGTTNLASGELITIRISGYMPLCAKCRGDFADSVAACCGEFNRTVAVREGVCGNNIWLLEVNTSLHDFHADDDYWIGVSGRNHGVENSSFFTVSGIPQPNLTLNLPENDAAGVVLRFSGRSNTGNGPDEKLLLHLSSDSGKTASFTVPVYWDGTGYFWNQSVSKSVIVPYNFLTVSVRSQTSPAISIQRVFLYNNESEYYPYYPNGP